MAHRDNGAAPSVPPDAQVVPARLIPALIQPAFQPPAPPLAVAGVVIGFLVAVSLLAFAGWNWYARSVLDVAVAGVKASVGDDMRSLSALIPSETAATPAFRSALIAIPRRADVHFDAPEWRGTGVTVRLTLGGKRGSVSLSPSTSALGEAVLRWTGAPFGDATGTVVLTDEATGWRLLYITVGKKGASFAPEDAAKTFAASGG